MTSGATAVGYFTDAWFPEFTSFTPAQETRDELTRLNGQITRLSRAILAPYSSRDISVEINCDDECILLLSRFMATEYEGYLTKT